MGVIRNGANSKGPFSAASCDVLDGFNSHDEGDEPVPLAVHVDHSSSLLERRRRTARRSMPACADVSGLGSRGKRLSSRKVRRLDNKHFLHDLAEEDEDVMGQLTIDDFVHQSVSAFSRLLADLDNHEVWDEVLNCTGQPQPLPEDQRSDKIAIEVASSLPPSGGYFQRLDAALRTLLRRQRVPLGTLCLMESELCQSFEHEPCGEKHYRLASSFERLLLHALCQYMSLFAHSYDMEGKRWTRVRNSNAKFCRPSESLSAYLERYWTARGAC